MRAQWLRLIALGAVRPMGDPADCDGLQDYVSAKTRGGSRRIGAIEDATVTAEELDTAARRLGAWIRRAHKVEARRVG